MAFPAARAAVPATEAIDSLLAAAVGGKRVPMVVAIVVDATDVVYERAIGAPKNAIFAIASMTKPVTSVAVMQLVESGKIKLDEPAATYLPELGRVQVLDGGKRRAPRSPITVRQLLTHTAGFGYEFMNKDLFDLVSRKELASARDGGDAFLNAPLVFDPGTRWEYGINTDWLGRIVERVSGQTLDAYLRSKIFQPLGMVDSYFNVPAAKQSRIAATFQRSPDGSLQKMPAGEAPKPSTFYSGGGGLFSTAPDYLRFVRAILAGGTLDGRRILSADTVATIGKNHIGNLTIRPMPSLVPPLLTDNAASPGGLDKFGLGFAINSKPNGTARAANTLAWAGIFNTFFWIDREKQIGVVLMTHMLPGLDPAAVKLVEDFERAVYAWKSGNTK